MFTALRRHFDTIYWKLTGSFVMLAVLLAVGFTILITLITFAILNSSIPLMASGEITEQYASMLRVEGMDREQVGSQIVQLLTSNGVELSPDAGTAIIVLDTSQRVITSTLPLDYQPGQLLSETEPQVARDIIAKALQGNTDTNQLASWSPPGNLLVTAAPLFNSNQQVIGAVYMRFRNIPTGLQFLVELPVTLLILLLPLLVLSGLIGLIYAWFAGSGFSRRLKQLTSTSAAFATGDLTQRVEDRSADEIGQLGRQFNSMAEQLAESMRALRLLADQNARLAEQASQLAMVEERNRLARDLHDSVSQELFSLSMLAAATRRIIEKDSNQAAMHLSEIQSGAQRALQETRSLIFALRPAALDGRGLGPALRELIGAAQDRQGLAVDLTISGERQLPLEHEQTLFRIVQEALANVVRHSGTRSAHVDLEYSEITVTLTVQDHGQGFDPQQPHKSRSIGLDSMRERALELGGSCRVTSAPGQGTTVQVILPVERALQGVKKE
jgi:signal transduction histidine kinase